MNYRKFLSIVLVVAIFMFFGSLKAIANNKAISWFILIADTHIGYNNTCKENLSWIVNDAYDVINPITIINAGDLTEQSLMTKDSQEEQQWIDYRQILDNANMNVKIDGTPIYADMLGNHDIWNEIISLSNYLKYSVQGIAQNDWLCTLPYGVYFQFIMTDTTDKDNISFATDATKCLGELDAVELDFIDNALKDMNLYLGLSFVFGHHAIGREGESDWGRIIDGRDEFIQLLNNYNVAFYGYGHTHNNHFNDPYYLNSETLVYNVKSLGKDNRYAIVAVDYGYISVTEAEVEKWPVVLITHPLDRKLGANDKLKTYNPFAQPILTQKSNQINALIFSDGPIHTDDVEFLYKEDKWTKRFKSIPDVKRDFSLNGENSHLWVANWDTSKLKSGDYLIRVDAGKASDEIAVRIKTFIDVVLVIDCSGSMGGYTYPTKMDSAKLSAQMFISSMEPDDKVGVVEFSGTASDIFPLTKIKGDNIKTEAKNAISALYAGGGTSIGAGLQAGQNQLMIRGADDPVWVMVLLSDGHEGSAAPMTKDVLPDIIGTKTKIYTIGLGEPDESLLNTIALTTGGFYRFASAGEDLTAIYQSIRNSVAGLQTIAEKVSDIIQGAKKKFTILVDSVDKVVFWATIGGSDIELILEDPNGNEINPAVAAADPSITYIAGTAHKAYVIENPQPGNWGMEVEGTIVTDTEPINVGAEADTDITLTLEFDKIEYVPDSAINVIAGLEDAQGVILGATVTADVQTPLGDANMILHDDGLHGDKAADDGIYANFFVDTNQQGNYTFKIEAEGTSNEGNVFTRTATKTTVVGQDTDGDGMADTWENVYGLNPSVDDSAQDPDGDGLTNLQEYSYRTNPQDSDTDGDGYSDKEEVNLGSDPLDFYNVPIFISAVCKDITIQLDKFDSANITVSQVDGGSTADNGIDTMTVSPSNFSFNDIGENLVTLTVTDMQGSIDECTAIVTVNAYSTPTPVPDFSDDEDEKDEDFCFISVISAH